MSIRVYRVLTSSDVFLELSVPMENDGVIYEPKGVDIYITLHYIIHYITLGPP